jgi:predicted ATPase
MQTLAVLVIEDVHWADEATLDLLSYLGRRIQHLPVLLLATYRDDALVSNDPLRLTLGGLASQRATRRLGLPTLSAAGVATLAQGTVITRLNSIGSPPAIPSSSPRCCKRAMTVCLGRFATLSSPVRGH